VHNTEGVVTLTLLVVMTAADTGVDASMAEAPRLRRMLLQLTISSVIVVPLFFLDVIVFAVFIAVCSRACTYIAQIKTCAQTSFWPNQLKLFICF